MANLNLEELEVYQRALNLGERIHSLIISWSYFYRISMGKQLLESSDSIAANISEGYGRYFYKENRNFCYYARGSLLETKTWITKAYNRKLISDSDYKSLLDDLNLLHLKLNNYIKSIGK